MDIWLSAGAGQYSYIPEYTANNNFNNHTIQTKIKKVGDRDSSGIWHHTPSKHNKTNPLYWNWPEL